MLFDHPILVAGLTGLISGILLSVPVGPVNLTILNEGARRGFRWALMIGLGATAMEVIYCAVAFAGFSSLFGNRFVKAGMELFSFVFLLYLGVRLLIARKIVAHTKLEDRLEEKLHPHSAFMTGFVQVLGNLGVLLFWVILAANFISRELVPANNPGKLACVSGVAVGTASWFFGLSYAVSLGHKRISEKTLLRMEHFSGICLVLLALAHGLRIIWEMANHRL